VGEACAAIVRCGVEQARGHPERSRDARSQAINLFDRMAGVIVIHVE
jgi:hypothetical protein